MAKFTDPTSIQLSRTLARRFVPLADSLRDMLTKFGLRVYKVRVIRQQWASGRRGVGPAVVTSAIDLLPTPKLLDLQTLQEIVQPVGLDEVGQVLVTQISGRFTEEALRGYGDDGSAPDPNEEVYYEIEWPRPDGKPGEKRRFRMAAAPMYFSGKLQWQVQLQRAHGERPRNGDPAV